MYCGKCGAQIPDSSIHCSSCGAQVSGEAPTGQVSQEPSFSSQLARADSVAAFGIAGSFLIILGALLPWMGKEAGFVFIGTFMPMGNIGVAVLLVGVLFLPLTVIARSGTAGAWGLVMLLLSAVELALIFQILYFMKDPFNEFPAIAAGYWIAMAGALGIGISSVLQLLGTSRE